MLQLPDISAAPLVRVPRSVATPKSLNVKVSREVDRVTMQIGNHALTMDYEAAMRLGQWLLAKGCEAKFMAGDMTRRVYVERR